MCNLNSLKECKEVSFKRLVKYSLYCRRLIYELYSAHFAYYEVKKHFHDMNYMTVHLQIRLYNHLYNFL